MGFDVTSKKDSLKEKFNSLTGKERIKVIGIGIAALAVLIFAIIGIIGVAQMSRHDKKEVDTIIGDIKVNTAEIKRIISDASDLVTVKDTYIVNESFEKNAFGNVELPFGIGVEKVTVMFTSEYGLGVDVSQVVVDVNDTAKTVTLVLPEPKIVYDKIDLENAVLVNNKDSVFVKDTNAETIAAMAKFQTEKEKEILADKELMYRATSNAENVLTDLLEQSGALNGYDLRLK